MCNSSTQYHLLGRVLQLTTTAGDMGRLAHFLMGQGDIVTTTRSRVTATPGTVLGFQAMLCLYPRERKAFFVAANADVETANYDALNKTLIAALRLAPPADCEASPGVMQWTLVLAGWGMRPFMVWG